MRSTLLARRSKPKNCSIDIAESLSTCSYEISTNSSLNSTRIIARRSTSYQTHREAKRKRGNVEQGAINGRTDAFNHRQGKRFIESGGKRG